MSMFHSLPAELQDDFTTLTRRYGRINHLVHAAQNVPYLGQPLHKKFSPKNISLAMRNISLGFERLAERTMETPYFTLHCTPKRKDDPKLREGIWQVAVCFEGDVAATLGVNLHEEEETVLSITHIQGRDAECIERMRDSLPEGTYWTVEAITALKQTTPVVRGITRKKHPMRWKGSFDKGRAQMLYDRSFKKAGLIPVRQGGELLYYQNH